MDVQGLGRTDTGRVRPQNEDAFSVDVEFGLYAVCDGIGGHAAGEIASATAIAAIERIVHERADVVTRVERDPTRGPELETVVVDAVQQSCRDVYNRARSDPDMAGMGCTATVLLVAGAKAAMAHVGDTRLYLIRGGQAHQLSSDHTLAADLVRQGVIEPEAEQGHPHAHVLTRALGPQPLVDVEVLSFDVVTGDRLVLCSDGLSDYIPSAAWLAERASTVTVEDLPDDLVDFANASGGRDNITAIAIAVEGQLSVPDPTQPVDVRLDILRSAFVFADLTLAQLARVLDRCQTRTYEPDDVIKAYGEIQDELFVITRGSVRVNSPDSRTALLGPSQHFGEALVMRPRPVRATVVANEAVTVLALDRSSLLDLAQRRPWLGVALLTRLGQRLAADLDSVSSTSNEQQPSAIDLL